MKEEMDLNKELWVGLSALTSSFLCFEGSKTFISLQQRHRDRTEMTTTIRRSSALAGEKQRHIFSRQLLKKKT